jgi:cytochrome c-type biogenesis protein
MPALLGGAVAALWLGILTSISPCPMASNIAAISYLGGNLKESRLALVAGLLYTMGRAAGYTLVGIVVITGLLSIPLVAMFLQNSMNRFLGPLLILVGLMLLNVIRIPFPSLMGGGSLQKIADTYGLWGAGLLGLLFSLSFCPVSAGIFFGSLIPISIENNSRVLIPAMFGVGSGLPVVVFAVIMTQGARAVGKAYDRLSRFEFWARRITGGVFILAGAYYVLAYWFGVSIW